MSFGVLLNTFAPYKAWCTACDSLTLLFVPLPPDDIDSIDIKYSSNRSSGLISMIQDPRSRVLLRSAFLRRRRKPTMPFQTLDTRKRCALTKAVLKIGRIVGRQADTIPMLHSVRIQSPGAMEVPANIRCQQMRHNRARRRPILQGRAKATTVRGGPVIG